MFYGKIGSFGTVKQRVGKALGAEKTSIELHPLGTSERRGLHIVGTLDDRYSQLPYLDGHTQLRELAVAPGIFKRREQYGVGTQFDYTLDIRSHAVAAIGNVARFYTLHKLRLMDVLHIAYSRNGTIGSKLNHKAIVD